MIRRVCSNSSNNNDNRSDSYYNENRDGQCTDNKDIKSRVISFNCQLYECENSLKQNIRVDSTNADFVINSGVNVSTVTGIPARCGI